MVWKSLPYTLDPEIGALQSRNQGEERGARLNPGAIRDMGFRNRAAWAEAPLHRAAKR